MTHTFKAGLRLILAGMIAALVLVGCQSRTDSSNLSIQTLKVQKAVDSMSIDGIFAESGDEYHYEVRAEVDFPTEGPQPLMDSVIEFVNERLYQLFDMENGAHIPFKKARVMNSDNIVYDYISKYRKLYGRTELNNSTYSLKLEMVAQTETFVTYEIHDDNCSAGCWYRTSWETFRKDNGHRVKELISDKDMVRFINENPWCDYGLLAGTTGAISVGLLDDGMVWFYDPTGWTEQMEVQYDYDDIFPYLGNESQALISGSKECRKEDHHSLKSDIIATLITAKQETIYLVARGYLVAAYKKVDDKYIPADVFKIGDGYQSYVKSIRPHSWNTSNPDGGYFAFDKTDNTLYLPLIENIAAINEFYAGNDLYEVYQFDGEHFVYKRKDAGYWLHPSLHKFKRFITIGKSEQYVVRIDLMADETYRYAAWKEKDNIIDKPDLVIYDGHLCEEGYVFTDNGYKYVVESVWDEDRQDDSLFVYHGEELILKQCLRDFR